MTKATAPFRTGWWPTLRACPSDDGDCSLNPTSAATTHHTGPMAQADRHQQQLHLDETTSGYRHRYCRRCGRPLTAQDSRRRGYGEHCDPTRQPQAAAARDIDQDTLPGT